MAERRIRNLDALRGVAAMTVLVQHVLGRIIHADPGGPFAALRPVVIDYFDWGRFGVVLFFLISGYVIPLSFSGAMPLRKFIISRIFRLYPAYWLSVIAMTAALALNGASPDTARILANLTMAYPVFREPAITGVYWTLIIELLFYAVAAGLFIVGGLERPRLVAAVALAGIGSAVFPILANLAGVALPRSLLGYHLSFLLLGSLLRQTLAADDGARAAAWTVGVALAATLPLVSGLIADPGIQYSIATPIGAILAVAAAVSLFVVSFTARFRTPSGIWLRLGAWSYAIYLFHEPFAEVGIRFVRAGEPWTALAFIVLVVLATLLLSAAVYRFIETPSIRAGRTLAHGRSLPQAEEVAP